MTESQNLAAARRYIEALWAGAGPDEVAGFLEFRDGRIVRQRNYDCFEPW
jgi:hypothetical protein